MPGMLKVKVARPGFDTRTASAKDLSFSSDYKLNKLAKAIRLTSSTPTAHGLPYAPKVLAMREIASNKFAWLGMCEIDSTNVTATLNEHATAYHEYGQSASADDLAVWAYIFADPLLSGSYTKNMKGRPQVIAGVGQADSDRKIHSGYDTFKVAKTGRLTLEAPLFDPGSGGGVDTRSVTYNHNLGYVPMFAPFVEYEIDKWAYLSWNGQYNSEMWSSGRTFYTAQEVMNEDTYKWYECKLTHTSSSTNKPETGASWETYWEPLIDPSMYWVSGRAYAVGDVVVDPDYMSYFQCIKAHTSSSTTKPYDGASWATYWTDNYQDPAQYTTYVNEMEDIKYVYGGYEGFNTSFIKYYATDTQLVLELTRTCYPSDEWMPYTPCEAETVYVDYTIFTNRADREFSLL